MHQHWAVEPPLEHLVYYLASYAGWKPAECGAGARELSGDERRRQAEELMAMFGASGATVR